MGNKFVTALLFAAMGISLSACSSMSVDKVWPFGDKSPPNQPKRLANATEYQCEGRADGNIHRLQIFRKVACA